MENNCSFSIETAQAPSGGLYIRVSAFNCSSDYQAAVAASFADRDTQRGGAYWRRPGDVAASGAALKMTPSGTGLDVGVAGESGAVKSSCSVLYLIHFC